MNTTFKQYVLCSISNGMNTCLIIKQMFATNQLGITIK